jgi:hypothetical protein
MLTTTAYRPASEHRFYVAVGVLVVLICLAGFGPSIIEPAGRNVHLPMTALVATHTIAGSTFVLLFLIQTILIATGRTSVHRRLGMVGLLAGIAFVVSGVLTSVEEARRGFDLSGDLVRRDAVVDPAFILAPINAFGLVAVLLGAGVWYRRRPDVHKRLLALTMLGGIVGAPIAHLVGHYPVLQVGGGALAPLSNLILLSLVPIHDRLTMGRIHPVSLWGAIGSFAWLFLFFTLVAPTSMWRTFTLWLIQ